MKHSPAPWVWASGYLWAADDSIVCDEGGADGEYRARLLSDSPNALLIAAAPELLAALEKMTYLADDSGKFLQLQDFIETAQAVIYKAKGEEVKDDTINPPYAVVPTIDEEQDELPF